ncbi:hypothetical protein [Arhodomonas sp. SL1]|uniref:hypothetical protein n=1 Tax=Arhodomonas sp. SL1 TaxID=3425691 RepID=UPI003F881A1D
MINGPVNVSAYEGTPPDEDEDRSIVGGPLYDAKAVLALTRADELAFWSRGAIRDAQKWSLEVSDVCRLVELAIRQGSYLGAQWCVQKPNGPWAACDTYKVTREEWLEAVRGTMPVTYYLKFCVAKTGTVLFSVSNHPEGT